MMTTKEQFDRHLQAQAEKILYMMQMDSLFHEIMDYYRAGHTELQFLIDMPVDQAKAWVEKAFTFYVCELHGTDPEKYPNVGTLKLIETVRKVRKERNKQKKAAAKKGGDQ
ncbi:hypothetical protein [uncultured Duncaniella sp.]|uniref:hypothetical protein n=1 Tax=uncultured Duncaniella sp. TaxID=2768039 RepID=UPI002603E412|nr:hypothetical protein [uncultured Duncaniella sp.]